MVCVIHGHTPASDRYFAAFGFFAAEGLGLVCEYWKLWCRWVWSVALVCAAVKYYFINAFAVPEWNQSAGYTGW